MMQRQAWDEVMNRHLNDRGNVNVDREEIDAGTYYCQHVFLQLTQLEGWKGLSLQCVSAHWICRTCLVSNYAGSREVRRVKRMYALIPPSETK